MVLLFAIGAHRHDPLVRAGSAVARLHGPFGDVFGVAFGIEGFSFFLEAIFVAIYAYGWDRLPLRLHFAMGVPIAITGMTGLVDGARGQRMDEPPRRAFACRDGEVADVQPRTALFNGHLWHGFGHMYLAGSIVAGFLGGRRLRIPAGSKGRRRAPSSRRARGGPPWSPRAHRAPRSCSWATGPRATVAVNQPVKLGGVQGVAEDDEGMLVQPWPRAPPPPIGFPNLLSLLAFHDPNATVTGLSPFLAV